MGAPSSDQCGSVAALPIFYCIESAIGHFKIIADESTFMSYVLLVVWKICYNNGNCYKYLICKSQPCVAVSFNDIVKAFTPKRDKTL